MKIGNILSGDDVAKIANGIIQRGDTFRMKMTRANGIVPKQGDKYRNKFFIVLGKDEQGNFYGGVVINSKINPQLPQGRKMLLMPIKASKYQFLEYDSFVDCAMIKVANVEDFNHWQYKGKIDEGDVNLIIGTVAESCYESDVQKRRFGII